MGKKPRILEVVQESVNEIMRKRVPTNPVHVIGKVPPCLFHFMASTPEGQEIRLSKIGWLLAAVAH